jgi:Golgi SNAP receptor complex protein 1
MDWESLKSRVREEQAVVEGLFRELHTLRREISDNPEELPVLGDIEREIDTKIAAILGLVGRLMDAAKGNAARTAQVHRIREQAAQWRTELSRAKEQTDRMRLIGKKTSEAAGRRFSEDGLLNKERSQLLAATGATNDSISLATEAKRMIEQQTRRTLEATEKLGNMATEIPGVNSLIAKIKNKKFRDELILATFIAAGLFWIFCKTFLNR